MDDNQNPAVPATDPNQGGMPSDQPVTPVTDQPASEAPVVSEEQPASQPEMGGEVTPEAPATTETPSGDSSTGAV